MNTRVTRIYGHGITIVAAKNTECENEACLGAFADAETGQVNRCDTCKIFACDEDAADFVNSLLQNSGN